MASLEWGCKLDADTKTNLQLYFFKNVKNVEEIRNNVMKGIWKCAITKPALILCPMQVAVAANKAIVSEMQGLLLTRSVYSEILYNLSLSKNIASSLRMFGIEKDNNLLVCFLKTADMDHSTDILPLIEGDLCPISELSTITDLKAIKKEYNLTTFQGNMDSLLDVILTRIVTKHFVSY